MKTKLLISIIILIAVSGCADVATVNDCLPPDPYGFWSGLWHGWIIIFSWIGSLFSDEIAIYAVNNNGGWYDFGFMLGIGSISQLFPIIDSVISLIKVIRK